MESIPPDERSPRAIISSGHHTPDSGLEALLLMFFLIVLFAILIGSVQ